MLFSRTPLCILLSGATLLSNPARGAMFMLFLLPLRAATTMLSFANHYAICLLCCHTHYLSYFAFATVIAAISSTLGLAHFGMASAPLYPAHTFRALAICVSVGYYFFSVLRLEYCVGYLFSVWSEREVRARAEREVRARAERLPLVCFPVPHIFLVQLNLFCWLVESVVIVLLVL